MPNLYKYPFLRLLIPFILGIWIRLNLPDLSVSNGWSWYLLGVALMAMLLARWLIRTYSLRWVFGMGLTLFCFVFGSLYTTYRTPSSRPNHIIRADEAFPFYMSRIIEPPEVRETTIKLISNIQFGRDSVASRPFSGKVIMYAQRNQEAENLQYGDLIFIAKAPVEVPEPKNPNQFNYKKHLASKGIYHQVFLKEDEWKYAGKGYSNPLYSSAYQMRDYLLNTLSKNGLDGDEFAVASAILLGYDENLPHYLRKGYAAAGAMHVLCVSGLHVGIIFLIFNFLLRFFNKSPTQQSIKTLILIILIWFYAMITGLSPSVNRASVMITIVLMAKLFNRKGNIINSLSASALLLLLINPYNLLHIGFQLSYSAVLGIVLFQKPIHNLIYIKNKHLDYAWEITALSFAAQLGTTPLAIYYFNQFPVYFWLSNLFLVPLSFIVITAGMGLLLLSFVPYLSHLLGLVTSSLLFVLNLIIQWIESLPMSTLQGLYINPIETFLLYIFIGMILLSMNYKPKRLLIPTLSVLLILFGSFAKRTLENNKAHQMIIYSIPNQQVYGFINSKEHLIIADSAVINNEAITGFNLEGHWTKAGLTKEPIHFNLNDDIVNHQYLYKNGHLIGFGNKQIAVWPAMIPCGLYEEKPFPVDLVIITGNQGENLPELLNCFQVSEIVIDPSVPVWHLNDWQRALEQESLKYHNIREHGAYIWDLHADAKKQSSN